jgi:hypothetical protein
MPHTENTMPIITTNDINAMAASDIASKKMWVDSLSAKDNVTATAGGGQANAVQINDMTTRVTTVGTAADSVKLPVAVPGLMLTVVNAAAANSMNLFPATGEAINALSANTALAVAAGKAVICIATALKQWHTILTA